MKKIILYSVTLLSTMLFVNSVSAESSKNEVQLTDYRYESLDRGLYGYTFGNIDAPIASESCSGSIENSKKYNNRVDSVILKPDGSEMFQQGKYSLVHRLYSDPEIACVGIEFPQYENYFIAKDTKTKKVCVFDSNMNTIAKLSENAMQGLQGIYDGHLVTGASLYGAEPHITTDGPSQTLIRLSDKKMIIDTMSIPFEGGGDNEYIGHYPELYAPEINISKDKKYFEVYGWVVYYVYDYVDERIKDDTWHRLHPSGIRFYFDREGNMIEKPQNAEFEPLFDSQGYLNADVNLHIRTDKVNSSYIFKKKNIGGITYYAVFKQLESGETAESYTPKEQPSVWAADNINKATEAGLLYNNANCRYKDNISRQDFCILAVEAFCKTQGMEVDEYIKANNITLDTEKFTDTGNAYVLLANSLGIVSGTSDTEFSPDRGITRQEAAVMLNNFVKLSPLTPNAEKTNYKDVAKFSVWAKEAIENLSAIQSNGVPVMGGMSSTENIFSPWSLYTREQAYVTIYRLYEMCDTEK